MTTTEHITANLFAGADALRWRQGALEGLATGRPLAEVLGLLARAHEAASPQTMCAFVVSGDPRLIAGPSLPDSLLDVGRTDASCMAPGSAFDIDSVVESFQGAVVSHGLAFARTLALTNSDGTAAGALLLFREADADPAPFAEGELDETVRLATLAMTESDRRLARLREATDLLDAVQRMGRMGSFEYHLDDDRWTLSDAWLDLFGADAGSVTTDELISLVHPDDRALVMNAFEAVRRGEGTQVDHRGIHCETGAVVHVRSRYDLVRDGSGRPLKIRGLTQDVSEEKRREQALTDKLRQLDLAETIAGAGSWTLDPAIGIVQWSE